MLGLDFLQLAFFSLVIILLTKPMGLYLCKILSYNESTSFEKYIYKFCKINPLEEHDWKQYLASILGFTFMSLIFISLLLALQNYLPLNPEKFGAPSWHLNLSTSVSYTTNTDYQSYSGEKTMSYFSQMAALAVQNFLSAAVGLATAAALVRGIAGRGKKALGNFWRDIVRINLYLLLHI